MKEDENVTLTMKNVGLTVSGWINVKNPPGSFPIDPDEMLDLADLLQVALDECGLGDRLRDVYLACDRAAEPRFAKRIAELEAIRLRVLGETDVAPLDQIEKIMRPTGPERVQHLPNESRKRPPTKR